MLAWEPLSMQPQGQGLTQQWAEFPAMAQVYRSAEGLTLEQWLEWQQAVAVSVTMIDREKHTLPEAMLVLQLVSACFSESSIDMLAF
jgi:hypothetical protein